RPRPRATRCTTAASARTPAAAATPSRTTWTSTWAPTGASTPRSWTRACRAARATRRAPPRTPWSRCRRAARTSSREARSAPLPEQLPPPRDPQHAVVGDRRLARALAQDEGPRAHLAHLRAGHDALVPRRSAVHVGDLGLGERPLVPLQPVEDVTRAAHPGTPPARPPGSGARGATPRPARAPGRSAPGPARAWRPRLWRRARARWRCAPAPRHAARCGARAPWGTGAPARAASPP